ncbi:MAG: alpha-amylase family protein [Thermoguttaceae bacterium]
MSLENRSPLTVASILLAAVWAVVDAGPAPADDWFAPCRSVAEYRPKGPAHCYRQFNLDWSWIGRGIRHTPELLSEADPVEFAEFCRADFLDGTIVMAVPHHGYCTYDTRVGTRFPGMQGDWFGRTIEELHKRKIAAFGYITINWNWKFMRENLGRDFVRAEAGPDGRLDGLICLNAPGFLERIEAHTREVLLGYPVDGLRYDILSTLPGCTCDGCRALYRELYGEELAAWDRVPRRRQEDFYQATVARVVSRLTRTGKQIKPSVPLWQNGIQSYARNDLNLGRTQDIAYNEYGDPFRNLFLKGVTNKEAVINGMMNDLPVSPTAKIDRPHNRLCLALGGRSYSYFGHKLANYRTALPGKEMAAWHRDELRPFFRMIAEIEPYLESARPVASAAVVFCEATRYRWPDYSREPYVNAMQAVTEACLARSLPLEFINCLDLAQPGKELSRFKTLVLPLTAALSPEQLDCLRRYVRDGGSLLVGGDALRHDAQGRQQQDFDLADEMGVRFRAVPPAGREPWTVGGELAGRPVAAEVKTLVEIEPLAGETLLEARQFDRAVCLLHVRSLGRGKIAFLASLDSAPLVQQTIDFLAGEAPVRVHPAEKRAVLTHQPQKRRWILHLIDQGSCHVEVSHAWAASTKVVAQYPATGWSYTLERTSAGLRIGVYGDADDRLLVLE